MDWRNLKPERRIGKPTHLWVRGMWEATHQKIMVFKRDAFTSDSNEISCKIFPTEMARISSKGSCVYFTLTMIPSVVPGHWSNINTSSTRETILGFRCQLKQQDNIFFRFFIMTFAAWRWSKNYYTHLNCTNQFHISFTVVQLLHYEVPKLFLSKVL